MEKKSVYKNYIFNTGYQIFLLIVPLITMPYVSRIFGADGIGEYSYAESITAIFVNIAPIGTVAYGRREVSYHQENREKRTRIFWNVLSLRVISGVLCCLIYIIYLFYSNLRVIPFILMINIVSSIIDVSWFFQGVEDFKLIAVRNFIIKFVMMCCIFIFVHEPQDLALYALIICCSTFLGNISVFTRLKKYIDRPIWSLLRPFEDISTVFSLFLPTLALTLAAILDKPMIGWLSKDYLQSGYYDQAQKIVSVLMMFITSLATVMTARVGYHFERNEMDKIQDYMYQNYRFVTLIAIPMCLGIIGVARLMIPLYLGDGYEEVVSVISILCLTILVIGISNVTGIQYLIPTKRQNLFTKSILIGTVFNFTFDLLLIPYFGACGAVIATVFAEVMINVVQLFHIRNEISFVRLVIQAKNYVIAGGMMYVTVCIINLIVLPDLCKLILMVITGMAVYGSLLYLLKDDFYLQCLNMVKQRLKGVLAN